MRRMPRKPVDEAGKAKALALYAKGAPVEEIYESTGLVRKEFHQLLAERGIAPRPWRSKPWEESRTMEFIEAYGNGASRAELCKMFGLTKGQCMGKAMRLGLTFDDGELLRRVAQDEQEEAKQ